jgi:GNAT superfamily N-acetyltransferase
MLIDVRQATAGDLPAVLALYAQHGMDDGKVLDLAQAQEIFAQFARYPSYHLYVASDRQDTSRIVATFALLVMHNLAHQGTPSAIVEDVVVDVSLRGTGIGSALINEAIELSRKAGCYKLALSSNRKRVQAHAFYESLGFERHGYSYVIETQA